MDMVGTKMKAGDYDRVRILDYLRMFKQFSPRTLWQHWLIRRDVASRMIAQFVKAGLVRKVGRGRYEVVNVLLKA